MSSYTKKIGSPIYQVKGALPSLASLIDRNETNQFLEIINISNVSDEEKQFLMAAAQRHLVFDYGRIAEYYAHASPEMQEIMEKLALVIIDFNKAIENGYVRISDKILAQYRDESNAT